MTHTERCSICGSARTEATFGPYGFLVSCRSCGGKVHLDAVMEPVIARKTTGSGWVAA